MIYDVNDVTLRQLSIARKYQRREYRLNELPQKYEIAFRNQRNREIG
jgi:hypothetical protein